MRNFREVINLENSEEKKETAAPLCQPYIAGQIQPSGEPHEIIIVGTAHVSEKSVQEVTKAIEELRPDIVAVELCPGRYRALTGQEEEREIKISELLSGKKLYFLLVQMFLAYIQKKIGDEMGVKPGSEMLAAIETAQRTGAKVALVDREVGITIQRFWSAMGIIDKIKLVFALAPAALGMGDEEDIDIETITQDDVVSQMISETFCMESWTGRALVCLYCTRPKIAPIPQIKIPKYIRVIPLRPPRASNFTKLRSGSLMSASPARADPVKANSAARRAARLQNLHFAIVMMR